MNSQKGTREKSGTKRKNRPEDVVSDLISIKNRLVTMTDGMEVLKASKIISEKWTKLSAFAKNDTRVDRSEMETVFRQMRSFADDSKESIHVTPTASIEARDLFKRVTIGLTRYPLLKEMMCDNPFPLDDEELMSIMESCEKIPRAKAKRMSEQVFKENCSKYTKVLVKNAETMQSISELLSTLESALSVTESKRKDMMKLEETFVSHQKTVLMDLRRSSLSTDSCWMESFDSMYDEMNEWSKDLENNMRLAITACYTEHRILHETNPEISERLTKIRSSISEDAPIFDENVNYMFKNSPVPKQIKGLPVTYGFHPDFALESDGVNGELFLGNVPCHAVVIKKDVQLLEKIARLYSHESSNAHVHVPKILGYLDGHKNWTIIFERIPSLNLIEECTGISHSHLKEMIKCLDEFMNRATSYDLILNVEIDQISVTRECKVTILPKLGYKHKCDVFEAVNHHPDRDYEGGFNQVYVGWFVQLHVFSESPGELKGDGNLELPKISKNCDVFTRGCYEILERLYTCHGEFCERDNGDVSHRIKNLMPKTHTCSMHTEEKTPAGLEYMCLKGLIKENSHGINLGDVDRSSNPKERFSKYVDRISREKPNTSLYFWSFVLLGEGGRGVGENARGISVLRELIRDIYELALEHCIFQIKNGVLIFSSTREDCTVCEGNCEFWGKQKTYLALGMATQMGMCCGVRWPFPMSLMTTEWLTKEEPKITVEMCAELYDEAARLKNIQESFGDFKKTRPLKAVDIWEIQKSHHLPNTVDLREILGSSVQHLRVPISSASLYLMENMRESIEKTQNLMDTFGKGLGNDLEGYTLSHVLASCSTSTVRSLISVTERGMDFKSFVSKIQFGEGLNGSNPLNAQKRAMFQNVIKKNAHLRTRLLRLLTGCDNPDTIANQSLRVCIGTELVDYVTDVRSCYGMLKLSNYDSEETLKMYLEFAIEDNGLIFRQT